MLPAGTSCPTAPSSNSPSIRSKPCMGKSSQIPAWPARRPWAALAFQQAPRACLKAGSRPPSHASPKAVRRAAPVPGRLVPDVTGYLAAVRSRATTIASRDRTTSFCGFGPGRADRSVMARNPAWQEDPTMEPAPARPRHEAIDHDDLLVHEWRVTQLTRLGIPWSLAQAAADHVDWHQVAKLVRRGCPPRLALQIVR